MPIFVVDEQDLPGLRGRRIHLLKFLLDRGEDDAHGRAPAGGGFHLDAALVSLHDLAGDGEPEPVPCALVVKKGSNMRSTPLPASRRPYP